MAEDKKDTRVEPNVNTTPPADPPQYEWPDEQGRDWPRLMLLAIVAILVAALIVFGSRWIYRSLTDNPSRDESTQTADKDEEKLPSGSSDSQTPARDPQSSTSRSSDDNSAENRSDDSSSQAGDSTTLPNSGPGHVVALFAGTTTVAAAAHYALARRR